VSKQADSNPAVTHAAIPLRVDQAMSSATMPKIATTLAERRPPQRALVVPRRSSRQKRIFAPARLCINIQPCGCLPSPGQPGLPCSQRREEPLITAPTRRSVRRSRPLAAAPPGFVGAQQWWAAGSPIIRWRCTGRWCRAEVVPCCDKKMPTQSPVSHAGRADLRAELARRSQLWSCCPHKRMIAKRLRRHGHFPPCSCQLEAQ
jgi:hypothetical protein